jgi:hypothetical protein
MKFLRNPYVVCALVAVALGVGYYRFRGPKVVVAPRPVAKQERPLIAGPDASVELDKLGWTPVPTRDPFRAAPAAPVTPTVSDHEVDPVAEALDLKAVWLQETGGWAVINGKILGEGDAILDFRVEKILEDGVVVQGPGGRRQVKFKPPSARPRPATVSTAAPSAKAPLKPAPGKQLSMQDVLNGNQRLSGEMNFGNPVTMQTVTKVLGQVLSGDNSPATNLPKGSEKSRP